jgi:hypothetical protein
MTSLVSHLEHTAGTYPDRPALLLDDAVLSDDAAPTAFG